MALCLSLPLFTCLFYVNSLWHGASLCPHIGSHISLVTLFCGLFPVSLTNHKLFYVNIHGIGCISFSPLSGGHISLMQLFDYLCHYSNDHLLQIRLGIRCLSCSITFWLSQTCCFFSAHMHYCYSCTLITHADCHMFNYCFSFHTSPLCNFLPSILSANQHSLLAA